MVCTGHVRRWWVQVRLVHPLFYRLATKCMLHSKFSVYVQWWWNALTTCIPMYISMECFKFSLLCFRLWTVQLQHEFSFKTVMHADWVFETVMTMTMVSKRSCMVARSLKRSCRMNMVSKRSCMVTGFLDRSCRWLWFQNSHSWWSGFETVMQHGTKVSEQSCTMARVLKRSSQGVPKGSPSL